MRLRLELSCAPQVRAKARYVIETFLDVLGVAVQEAGSEGVDAIPVLGYGHLTEAIRDRVARSGGAFIHASAAGEQFFQSKRRLEPQEVAYMRWGSAKVPLLFRGAPSAAPDEAGEAAAFASRDGRIVELSHDIILSSFYFLSRWEETVSTSQDDHGRFQFRDSLAGQLALSENVVDLYFDIFRALLNETVKCAGAAEIDVPLWEGRRTFAACLTHDVDVVRTPWRSRARSLVNIARPPSLAGNGYSLGRRAAVALQILSKGEHARWTFPEIMSCEEQFGFRSSFYFQAPQKPGAHCDFSLSELRIRDLLAELLDRGFEVGLHGSYVSAFDLEQFCDEKRALDAALGQAVTGHRQHYLRFDYELAMPIYERSGLHYDSSLGFAEQEGYRNQFSYPFHPYNISQDRPFAFLELPLVIMDATLYGYRRLTAQHAWDTIEGLLQQAHERRGCITILWHNPSFSDAERPAYRQIYVKALRWIAEHNGLGTTGTHVNELWRSRRQGLGNGSVLAQTSC